MTTPIIEKLRKVLAMTESPFEAEAQSAAEMLQRLLTEHNLSMADLEKRGSSSKPDIIEQGHDLGKAAFTWKLNLAEVIADHYFCLPLVNNYHKTVVFVGRPDNVESLDMLYGWVIDQIKRIAREERRKHIDETGEHIDPLRWQVNFGLGAVERLRTRLHDLREQQRANITETALVLSHRTEISDYMEEKYGYRRDGQPTAEQRRSRERAEQMKRQKEEDRAAMDDAAFWAKYPEEHPDFIARMEKDYEKWAKQAERNARRRKGRRGPRVDEVKEAQGYEARRAGRSAADRVNLQPFVSGPKPTPKVKD